MHSKKITRNQPAPNAPLLDVSNLMNEEWGWSGNSLAAGAVYAVNRTRRDLLFNACIRESEVLNYMNLAISVAIPCCHMKSIWKRKDAEGRIRTCELIETGTSSQRR